MIFSTSQDRIKNALFSPLLGKIMSHMHRTHIVFFYLHRVIDDSFADKIYPKLIDNISHVNRFKIILNKLNKILPIIDINTGLDFLEGKTSLKKSSSVLLIGAPYKKTIDLIKPIIEKQQIAISLIIDPVAWPDELALLFSKSKKNYLSLDFFDRYLPLGSLTEKRDGFNRLLEYLFHCEPDLLQERLIEIRHKFGKIAVKSAENSLCSQKQIHKLSESKLVALISTNHGLGYIGGNRATKIFYGKAHIAKEDLLEYYRAAIRDIPGLAYPSDNMFYLPSLPFKTAAESYLEWQCSAMGQNITQFLTGKP